MLPKASWLAKSRAAPQSHSGTFWFSHSMGFKDMKSETKACFSLELWESLVMKERPFKDPANLPQTLQLTAVSLGLPGHPPRCLKPSYVCQGPSARQQRAPLCIGILWEPGGWSSQHLEQYWSLWQRKMGFCPGVVSAPMLLAKGSHMTTPEFRRMRRRNHLSEISPIDHDGHSIPGQEEWTGGLGSEAPGSCMSPETSHGPGCRVRGST